MESTISDELWAQIRMNFGDHCIRSGEYERAIENFEASLSFDGNKLDSVYRLAREHAREAKLDEALEILNEKSGLDAYKRHFKCNLQECDCHYERNEFERNFLSINEKKLMLENVVIDIPHCTAAIRKKIDDTKQKGLKLSTLKQRFEMDRRTYDDTIGKNAGSCLVNQRKYFDKVLDQWKPKAITYDFTPVILQNREMSESRINIDNKEDMPLKTKHRIDVVRRTYAQCYMQSAWKDFLLIDKLKENRVLKASKQNAMSFKVISESIDDCKRVTSHVIEELHARCPLYTKRLQKISDPKRQREFNRVNKYRQQFHIRCEMFSALDDIRKCRVEGNLRKLIRLAEYELGFRFRIHSLELIPRRDEFVVEICNYIALTHIDMLTKLPADVDDLQQPYDDFKMLAKILNVNVVNKNDVHYVFGDQSTYRDPAEPDSSLIKFKENMSKCEKRLKQRPLLKIEQCYLLHEAGKENVKQQRADEARNYARRVIEKAQDVSHLWIFLGLIMYCQADVLQRNLERVKKDLTDALNVAEIFKSDDLKNVLETAIEITKRLLFAQKNSSSTLLRTEAAATTFACDKDI